MSLYLYKRFQINKQNAKVSILASMELALEITREFAITVKFQLS
jgi:hypothetical protein